MQYDLIIIGGGPAAAAAGVYAARKKIKALIITDMFGGQSVVSPDIQNWIGTPSISGLALAQSLEAHVRVHKDIEIADGEPVISVEKNDNSLFSVKTKSKAYEAKTILIASGSRHRRLNIPGEKEFEGRGVFYCSTCDAPFFDKKSVAVIGGGNSALEAVLDLVPYASSIYLVHHGSILKGDAVTQEKIKKLEKVTVIYNAETKEIVGGDDITGIRYVDKETNQESSLSVDGVFVEIGAMPNSEFVANLVDRNQYGAVVTDTKTQRTSCAGIWAAGDVTDFPYRQNNISVGSAIVAILNINEYLSGGE